MEGPALEVEPVLVLKKPLGHSAHAASIPGEYVPGVHSTMSLASCWGLALGPRRYCPPHH
jgi:hypothetical protein